MSFLLAIDGEIDDHDCFWTRLTQSPLVFDFMTKLVIVYLLSLLMITSLREKTKRDCGKREIKTGKDQQNICNTKKANERQQLVKVEEKNTTARERETTVNICLYM